MKKKLGFKDMVQYAVGDSCKHNWKQIHNMVKEDKLVVINQCLKCMKTNKLSEDL